MNFSRQVISFISSNEYIGRPPIRSRCAFASAFSPRFDLIWFGEGFFRLAAAFLVFLFLHPMAAAVGGLTTCFACPTPEFIAPSTSYSAPVRVFFKPFKGKRFVLRRGGCWGPKCEIDPNFASVRIDQIGSNAPGLSALELLKTSSVNSECLNFRSV